MQDKMQNTVRNTATTQPKRSYISFTFSALAMSALLFGLVTACTDRQAKAKPNFVTKDAPAPGVVAKIGGENITEEELMGDDKLSFFDLKKKEYDLKMTQLNQLLIKKLIGNEAKKANMDLDAYIQKNVTKGEIKISDAEYKKFVKEKQIPEAQINEQLKTRIFAYLKEQKKDQLIEGYVAKLTKSQPVEVYFKKPRMNVNVEVGQAPVWGNTKAAVTIIEFSDFQCPFCSRAATTVSEIKKKYSGKVQIAFKHFPLPMHKDARPAAEASMCVHEQGGDKFWKFHDLAFKAQDKLDKDSLQKLAKDSGADVKKFNACLEAKKFASVVDSEMAYGEKLGVRSTPTFFINGQLVAGALPIEQISEIIDEELAEAKSKN